MANAVVGRFMVSLSSAAMHESYLLLTVEKAGNFIIGDGFIARRHGTKAGSVRPLAHLKKRSGNVEFASELLARDLFQIKIFA